MNEYELLIETINPCGGEAHSKEEFLEIRADSPEAYVAQHGHYPILDGVGGAPLPITGRADCPAGIFCGFLKENACIYKNGCYNREL